MTTLTGIGEGFYEQWPASVQQLYDLHLPDCKDKFTLLDQCAHCYRPYHSTTTYLATSAPPVHAAHYAGQEQQRMQRVLSRSYAEVAGTPPPPPMRYTAAYSTTSLPTLQSDDGINDVEPHWNYHTNVEPFPISTTTAPQTWAEVASDSNHVPGPRYEVQLQIDSSFLENQVHIEQNMQHSVSSFSLQHSQIGRIPARQIQQPNVTNMHPQVSQASQNTSHTQRQPNYLIPSTSQLPLVREQVTVRPAPISHPRDVPTLIQQTAFGGHRHAPSQSLEFAGPSTTPLSPGSVASSQRSRASSRRKGDEMRDARFPCECLECHKRFPKNEDLRRHVNRTHANVADRPHPCPVNNCPWRFVNPKDLNRHLPTHASAESGGRPRINCPHYSCLKSYTRADNLQRHINKEHVNDSAYMSQSMSRTTSSRTSFSQSLYE